MSRTIGARARRSGIAVCLAVVGAATISSVGCTPGDVLSVPPPVGVISGGSITSAGGAEQELAGATEELFSAIAVGTTGSLVLLDDWFTDEFGMSAGTAFGPWANIDARYTALTEVPGFQEGGDAPLEALLTARSSLLVAAAVLAKYEPASGQSKIGEAYALAGYAELLMAEDYCAGVPLSTVLPAGGVQYGMPLTSDSLLGTAEAHFNLALKYAANNDSVVGLASVGLGRTLVDRGQFALAATAVATVAPSFAFYVVSNPPGTSGGFTNIYQYQLPGSAYGCGYMQMSNVEGSNGLDYVSADDPRLVVDSTIVPTCDGGTWYYPIKFGNPSTRVPLATGVEAQLIVAEAALQTGNVAGWASSLNALRANAPSTYLASDSGVHALASDSTTGASADEQVDVMFRERAFWLYGTGTRVSDLRRLVREYGRDQSTVWPTGTYLYGSNPNLPSPLPTYGTDVSFTLPTAASGYTTSNPYYRGCLSPPSTA